jgi:hypothetical protein
MSKSTITAIDIDIDYLVIYPSGVELDAQPSHRLFFMGDEGFCVSLGRGLFGIVGLSQFIAAQREYHR